ncbi:MAG: hypothetical protein F9K18_02420 [Thermoanaerobaculia bacterium]|nr:MAG: hypothetical protein F9K18_02420 [Thermoanaerobaculia bacterium]
MSHHAIRLFTARAAVVLGATALLALTPWTARPAHAEGVYGSGLFELGDSAPPPGMPGAAELLADPALAGPDWENLFDADGKWRDDFPYDPDGRPLGNGVPDFVELFGGDWAFFADDYVSAGSGFEGDALTAAGGVVNGVVQADHDIGDAYLYSTRDRDGNVVLYLAMERLGGGGSSVEFELNQGLFRIGSGGFGIDAPWEVLGARVEGDFRVSVTFAGGLLVAASASAWDGFAWLPLSSLVGEGCDAAELLCVVGNAGAIPGAAWGEGPIEAGRFFEVGVNVGALLGGQPGFTTVQIRTPEDLAFGYFGEGN